MCLSVRMRGGFRWCLGADRREASEEEISADSRSPQATSTGRDEISLTTTWIAATPVSHVIGSNQI